MKLALLNAANPNKVWMMICKLNRNTENITKPSKRDSKKIIMTPLEADGAIQNARELEYTLQWDQSHVKSGKSGPRYEK